MVKCPFCGYEGSVESFKHLRDSWRFRFYTVEMLQCPKCNGTFNYYYGVSPATGKKSEFVIRLSRGSEQYV